MTASQASAAVTGATGTGAVTPTIGRRAVDVLAFEWTKLRSIRSNYWTLTIAAVVSVCITVLVVHAIGASPATPTTAPFDSLTISFLAYAEYAVLPVSILGVLAFTSEYSTGLIRTTFTAVPQRWKVLAAKASVTGLAALLAGEVLAFASFLLTQAFLTARHGGLPLSHPGVLGGILGAGFLMPLCVLIGLGLGAIIRHTAGAIAATVGVVYLLAALCLSLPAPWNTDVGRFTPAFAAYQVVALHPLPTLFSPVVSLAILIAWPAVILLIGGLVVSRRDA